MSGVQWQVIVPLRLAAVYRKKLSFLFCCLSTILSFIEKLEVTPDIFSNVNLLSLSFSCVMVNKYMVVYPPVSDHNKANTNTDVYHVYPHFLFLVLTTQKKLNYDLL